MLGCCDAEMAFCVDAVTTEMLVESIKTGIKHHSAHMEDNHISHFLQEMALRGMAIRGRHRGVGLQLH